MSSKDCIQIYADGACRGNNYKGTSPGGWGVVMLYKGHIKELKGYFNATTNNIMEIVAVKKGLQAIKDKTIPVEVYSDSQYVVSTINEGWVKRANHQYWKELYVELSKLPKVTFIKVKGHSDNQYNNRADQLANEAIDEHK